MHVEIDGVCSAEHTYTKKKEREYEWRMRVSAKNVLKKKKTYNNPKKPPTPTTRSLNGSYAVFIWIARHMRDVSEFDSASPRFESPNYRLE